MGVFRNLNFSWEEVQDAFRQLLVNRRGRKVGGGGRKERVLRRRGSVSSPLRGSGCFAESFGGGVPQKGGLGEESKKGLKRGEKYLPTESLTAIGTGEGVDERSNISQLGRAIS